MIIAGELPQACAPALRDAHRRACPFLAAGAGRQPGARAVDGADLPRPRAGGPAAAPRRVPASTASSSCRRRKRWPRTSTRWGWRRASPGSPAWSAGSTSPPRPWSRSWPRSQLQAGWSASRPVRDDNRSIGWMLDARYAAGLTRIRGSRASCSMFWSRTPTRSRSSPISPRAIPTLRLVLDHCAKPDIKGGRLRALGRRYRRAGRSIPMSPASSPAS